MSRLPNVQYLERIYGVTWLGLVEVEPRLVNLLCRARLASVACMRWSDVVRAFAPIRIALAELIGFAGENHRHPVLGGPRAYQIAYWKLFDAVAGSLAGRADGAAEGPQRPRAVTRAETAPTELAAARDAIEFIRRSERARIAFWFGAIVLGIGGCILGACMPYTHPVALTISALWWGLFLGCFGGSLGALYCVLTEGSSPSRSPVSDGAAKLPDGPAISAFTAGRNGSPDGANGARTASSPSTRSIALPAPARRSA